MSCAGRALGSSYPCSSLLNSGISPATGITEATKKDSARVTSPCALWLIPRLGSGRRTTGTTAEAAEAAIRARVAGRCRGRGARHGDNIAGFERWRAIAAAAGDLGLATAHEPGDDRHGHRRALRPLQHRDGLDRARGLDGAARHH